MADLENINPDEIPVAHDDDDTGTPDPNPDATAEADEDESTDPIEPADPADNDPDRA